MVLAGILPWQVFSSSLIGASNSLVSNANLIGKVYFPRLIVPSAAMVVSIADFIVSLILLFGVMAWYKYLPGWQVLTLPVFLVMATLASIGPGFLLASLNVKYRDFRYIIPFIVQLGLYASPVGFSLTVIPEEWRLLYSLNPMVGVIEGFRWAILGENSSIYAPGFVLSWLVILFFLWLGIRQFRRTEKTFADLM